MSKIVRPPSALLLRNIPGKEKWQPHHRYVTVDIEYVSPGVVDEFLDFLRLVYGREFRVLGKNLDHVCCKFYLNTHTEAGLRVASWLYGIHFHVAQSFS